MKSVSQVDPVHLGAGGGVHAGGGPSYTPRMVGVVPSMVGVVPSTVGVVPNMVGVIPNMVGVLPSMVGVDKRDSRLRVAPGAW